MGKKKNKTGEKNIRSLSLYWEKEDKIHFFRSHKNVLGFWLISLDQ